MNKWVLVFKMPSGQRYVLAPRTVEGKEGLALFPVSDTERTALKGVFAFETEKAARGWMKETAELSEQGEKMMSTTEPMLADTLQ